MCVCVCVACSRLAVLDLLSVTVASSEWLMGSWWISHSWGFCVNGVLEADVCHFCNITNTSLLDRCVIISTVQIRHSSPALWSYTWHVRRLRSNPELVETHPVWVVCVCYWQFLFAFWFQITIWKKAVGIITERIHRLIRIYMCTFVSMFQFFNLYLYNSICEFTFFCHFVLVLFQLLQ